MSEAQLHFHRNFSLRRFNTLGVESKADEAVCVVEKAQLEEAIDTDQPVLVLGGGSNLVLRRRFPGRVVRIFIRGVEFSILDDGKIRVQAGAGENWNEIVRTVVGRGISGLENLVLIPGSVGAAPFQNIGAYGRELSELVELVEVFDLETREFFSLSKDECEFRYRDSLFKSRQRNRYIITSVSLLLGGIHLSQTYKGVQDASNHWPFHGSQARGLMESVARIRRSKLPDYRRKGNVGSFFKNPTISHSKFDHLKGRLDIDGYTFDDGIRVPAARLIDACGWKGRLHQGVGVWHRQPLVLVNEGSSYGSDFLNVAEHIAEDVHSRYDISLELEPIVAGVDA